MLFVSWKQSRGIAGSKSCLEKNNNVDLHLHCEFVLVKLDDTNCGLGHLALNQTLSKLVGCWFDLWVDSDFPNFWD